MIQRINNISFKGVEKKPTPIEKTNVSNPIINKEMAHSLPVGDKNLIINPSLPSDFLGEADLAKYKKVQKEWAESMSKRLETPLENIMARLPEIKFGDAKTMLHLNLTAQFLPYKNIIEINPIRELTNLAGGDNAKIVHESTHGFFHNIRRVYARELPQEQLYQNSANIIVRRILQGEHGPIMKSFKSSNVDGQIIQTPEFMTAPSLSIKERKSLLNTLNLLQSEHIDINTFTLNDAGKAFVKENLLPHLTDYSKHVVADPEKKEEKICKKMIDYFDSFITRRNLLINNLISPECLDFEKNMQTPLTETERNMARNSLGGLISAQEANYLAQHDPLGISDNFLKSYFTSYEEVLAREEENIHRLEQVNQKIEGIKTKGIKPSANLLLEKQTAENNLKLLNLTRELNSVEKQIIGSEKNPEKMLEIDRIKQEMNSIIKANEKANISKYIDINELKFNVRTNEDYFKLIENKVPPESRKYFLELFEHSNKIIHLNNQLNQLNSPEKLLADTAENITLKSQFDNLMTQIRKLSTKSDLMGIPRQFFNSEADYMKIYGKAINCMEKWARRIL